MSTPLYIALHHGEGLVSRLIRWQTRSPWNHAALVLRNGSVVESREGFGVRQLPKLVIKPGEVVNLFAVNVTTEQADSIEAFILRQLGKPYDWAMVARFVSRRQEGRSTTGKWFCSELVYAAFQQAGVDLLRDTEPWEVSPGLLARSPHLQLANVHHFPRVRRVA